MVRYKNRFITIKYDFEESCKQKYLDKPKLVSLLEHSVLKLHGRFGQAAVSFGFYIKYLNPRTQIALIKVRLGPHKLVASALPFMDKPVHVTAINTSATIKQAFKYLRSYQLHQLEKLWKDRGKKMDEAETKLMDHLMKLDSFNVSSI